MCQTTAFLPPAPLLMHPICPEPAPSWMCLLTIGCSCAGLRPQGAWAGNRATEQQSNRATEQHHTSRYHSSIVCVRAPTRACVCVYGVVCGRSEPGTKARAAASRVCARGSVRGAAAARSPGDKTRAHGLCALADCGRSCCGMLPAPVRSPTPNACMRLHVYSLYIGCI